MAKEIKYGTEARTALGAGVDKLEMCIRDRETVDYSYLYTLSTDAAPAIEKYAGKSGAADYRKQGWYQLYCEANEEALNETGLRTYNVSHAVAKQLLMEDNRE